MCLSVCWGSVIYLCISGHYWCEVGRSRSGHPVTEHYNRPTGYIHALICCLVCQIWLVQWFVVNIFLKVAVLTSLHQFKTLFQLWADMGVLLLFICQCKFMLYTEQSHMHAPIKCVWSLPQSGVMLFDQLVFLQVFWNCVFCLWSVQLLLRDPSSCSSILWSYHHHHRHCPWWKQAGAWETWWSCAGSLSAQQAPVRQMKVRSQPSGTESRDNAELTH